MRTTVLAILFAIFSATASFSQVNIMGYGSFIHDLNRENTTNTSGGGLRLEFGKKETNFSKYFGIAYARPIHYSEQLEAQAMSSQTSPSSVKVTANYSRPMLRLEAGGNLYLAGGPRDFNRVNWYIGGAIEAIYMANKPTFSNYDDEQYTLGYTPDSDVNLDGSAKFDLNLHAAVLTGVEKNVGAGSVFLQTGISFPVYHPNSIDGAEKVESFSPIPLNLNIGYKIPFGKK